MATFFEFEADFVDSLRCIPIEVRYKLDTCGIKLKLSDWHEMTTSVRENLVELPSTTAAEIQSYHDYLQQVILELTGNPPIKIPVEAHPPWLDPSTVPLVLQEKSQQIGVNLERQQWSCLTPLQRFALLKLCRSGHENKNFSRAMAEFNLL
jgi:hypothetical protein